jgi:hypothetical protein
MRVKISSAGSNFNGWTGTIVESAGNNHEWVKLNKPEVMPDWVKLDDVFNYPLMFRKSELETLND